LMRSPVGSMPAVRIFLYEALTGLQLDFQARIASAYVALWTRKTVCCVTREGPAKYPVACA
jgi:hypothetical protein